MTTTDLASRFAYHAPPNQARIDAHTAVRTGCLNLAQILHNLLPGTNRPREAALATTHLEEVMFWANAALARDTSTPGPDVAAEIARGVQPESTSAASLETMQVLFDLAIEHGLVVQTGTRPSDGACLYELRPGILPLNLAAPTAPAVPVRDPKDGPPFTPTARTLGLTGNPESTPSSTNLENGTPAS